MVLSIWFWNKDGQFSKRDVSSISINVQQLGNRKCWNSYFYNYINACEEQASKVFIESEFRRILEALQGEPQTGMSLMTTGILQYCIKKINQDENFEVTVDQLLPRLPPGCRWALDLWHQFTQRRPVNFSEKITACIHAHYPLSDEYIVFMIKCLSFKFYNAIRTWIPTHGDKS